MIDPRPAANQDYQPAPEISSDDRIQVRPYRPEDREAIERLFHEGLLPGHVDYAPDEADRIRETMRTNRQRFWVAEADGQIIGTIAMVEAMPDVGQIHWLRVAPEWQSNLAVAAQLRAAVTAFAREMGLLKLVLQAPADVQDRLAKYYQQAGFQFSRARERNGRHLLEFYLNLYERPRRRDGKPAP